MPQSDSPSDLYPLAAPEDPCALVGVINAVGISLVLYAAGFAGWWLW